EDGSLKTMLSVSSGSLILQNARTVLGTFDPLKSFGTSAYGPMRLRPVAPDGIAGDWIPLATLVRLPSLDSIHCPTDPAAACTLAGSQLYLVDAIATDQSFTAPVNVPEGFVGDSISLPRPPKSGFYMKLRDEPQSANLVNLPVQIQRAAPAAPVPPPQPTPPAGNQPVESPSADPAASAPPPQNTTPQAH
ncbi:MAG TPA: hypothetical protein VIM60_05265, partial [Edaphobacter sp.]